MKNISFLLLLFVSSSMMFGQSEIIKISSERNENIIKIYAENTSAEAYNVELNINSTGFKHTRVCPIFETIQGGEKMYMTTLISKKGELANYSVSLKFSPSHPAGGGKKNKEIASEVSNTDVSTGIIVFSKNGCGRCKSVEKFLKEHNVAYTGMNISKNPNDASLMWQKLSEDGFTGKSVQTPVFIVNGTMYYNLPDYNELLRSLAKN